MEASRRLPCSGDHFQQVAEPPAGLQWMAQLHPAVDPVLVAAAVLDHPQHLPGHQFGRIRCTARWVMPTSSAMSRIRDIGSRASTTRTWVWLVKKVQTAAAPPILYG